MRKFFTLIFISTFGIGVIFAQAQPINPIFSDWSAADVGELPTDWDGTNISQLGQELECVTKITTDPHSGTYAAHLESKFLTTILGDLFLPGVITLGVLDIVNQGVSGGMDYTDRPATLKGWYKYTPVNNDTASIGIYLIKGATPDTIATGGVQIITATDTWTEFSIDLDYQLGEDPDKLNILFSSSSSQDPAHTGSVLIIDDISLEGLVLSTNKIVAENDFTISPNPANGYFNLKLNTNNVSTVKVHNTVGQVIITKKFDGNINSTFDVSDLNKGIYFVEVTSNGSSKIKKLVIK